MNAETYGDFPSSSLAAIIEQVGTCIEVAGVAVIAIGAIFTTVVYLLALVRRSSTEAYAEYRMGLARSILLGLELLVAGDISRTVVVSPTLLNVALLAAIVLVRTFLSFTLELEVTGRWPWRRDPDASKESSRRPV